MEIRMNKLRGIIGFPLAPFKKDFSLDLEALEAAVDELARHPFCALNAPAGISEAFSLSIDEAVAITRTTVDVVAGRMPVIGCVTGGWSAAREGARRMEDAGADAILVLPPTYQNPPFSGMLAYYKSIGESTGLPLAIYTRGWASFTPAEVMRLADEIPTLAFWKDGQGEPRALRRIMLAGGERLTWIGGAGDDNAAAYTAIGIDVFTSSISAVSPRLALAWGEAALAADFERLSKILTEYIHPLFAIRTRRRGYEIAAMKKLKEWGGRPAGPCRPPLPGLTAADEADLKKVFESWRPYLD